MQKMINTISAFYLAERTALNQMSKTLEQLERTLEDENISHAAYVQNYNKCRELRTAIQQRKHYVMGINAARETLMREVLQQTGFNTEVKEVEIHD